MISKQKILDQAKGYLPVKERKLDGHLNGAFMFAVAEVSTKLMESHRLAKVNETIAINTREITLDGLDADLSQIYYLLYGTGDDQDVLEYIDPSIFLEKYNSTATAAGTPTKFTFIGEDEEGITIRFDCPAKSATTMDVWYFRDMDVNSMRDAKGPALLNLTVAYFYGVGTASGAPYYQVGRGLIKDVRANAKPIRNDDSQFEASQFDKSVAVTRSAMRNRR